MRFESEIRDLLSGAIPPEGVDSTAFWRSVFGWDAEALLPVISQALTAARDAGKVGACPNNGSHNHRLLMGWEAFVEKGPEGMDPYEIRGVLIFVRRHLGKTFTEWQIDPEGLARLESPDDDIIFAKSMADAEIISVETIKPDHAERIASILARELEDPRSPPASSVSGDFRSSIDGRHVDVRLDGWVPSLYQWNENYDGIEKTPPPVMRPPARHYEISTSGKLVVYGRKDFGGVLDKMVRKAEKGLPYISIESDLGANSSALRAYGTTGMLEIHLGDHFPQLVRDGGVIRANWIGEGDVPEGCEVLHDRGLHMPVMGCLDRAMAFVSEMGGDAEKALAELEGSGYVAIIDVTPGVLHVYGPDGWRVDEFSKKVRPAGLSDVPDGEDCFFISTTPLSFDADRLDVDMPEVAVETPSQEGPDGP